MAPSRLALVSGQVAWANGATVVPSTLVEQTAIVIENLANALSALNASPHNILHMRIYATELTPKRQAPATTPLLTFLKGAKPSSTGVGVTALAAPELQIEGEMVVQVPSD